MQRQDTDDILLNRYHLIGLGGTLEFILQYNFSSYYVIMKIEKLLDSKPKKFALKD